ncbi:MAG: signal peptidase II [Planctomycetaceae bacterium]|nr:signal peptidase II [Planctomycetaceae bacterium]
MNSMDGAQTSQSQSSLTGRQFVIRCTGFVMVSVGCAFADLYTKSAVFEKWGFPNGRSPEWVQSWVTFRFHTSFNRGALWGIGQDLTWMFTLLSLIAVGVILYWVFFRNVTQSWTFTIALASILAGTLGNLYDRLGCHGYRDPVTGERYFAVRDFLLFRFGTFDWPVFNLADVFLVTGAVYLIFQSLFGPATLTAFSDPDRLR